MNMDIVVALLVIALIAAIAFGVMQRRRGPGAIGARGVRGSSASPLRGRRGTRNDPMAAAVADHAQAIDPQDVVEAERRLQAQAGQVAAGLQADARRSEHDHAAEQVAGAGAYGDPRMDGYVAPAADPRADDPRYDDPRYDGRLAGDYVDPRTDDRNR
jgi:hypothetical protein